MRQTIESVPTNGQFVILEDDKNDVYDVARWSRDANGWIRENGDRSSIAPTFWHALPRRTVASRRDPKSWRDRRIELLSFLRVRAAERQPIGAHGATPLGPVNAIAAEIIAASRAHPIRYKAKRQQRKRQQWTGSIVAVGIAAALIALWLRTDIGAHATRRAIDQTIAATGAIAGRSSGSIATQPDASMRRDGAQFTLVADDATEALQLFDKERRRADALAHELAEARQVIAAHNSLQAAQATQAAQLRVSDAHAATELRLAVDEARERAASLEKNVAETRRELNANAVQYRYELSEERERNAALARALASLRADFEARVAKENKAPDDAGRPQPSIDAATAGLRQALQQAHDRTVALERDLSAVRGEVESRAAKTNDEAAQLHHKMERDADNLRQSLQQERDRIATLAGDLATARAEIEARKAKPDAASDHAARVNLAIENATGELQQALQQSRDDAEALTRALVSTRADVEAHLAVATKARAENAQVRDDAARAAETAQRSLREEQAKAEALSRDLVAARRDVGARTEQLNLTNAEIERVRQASNENLASAKLALQQVRGDGAAITQELAKARDTVETLTRDLTAARRDAEARAGQLNLANAEIERVRQASSDSLASAKLALQQVRGDGAATAQELAKARETIAAAERAAVAQAALGRRAAEAADADHKKSLVQEHERIRALETQLAALEKAAAERSAPAKAATPEVMIVTPVAPPAANPTPTALNSQEAIRLLARASSLLSQGNVGAARAVLERAVDMGSAQAAFALAETYDPLILSSWRTYGTRGDAAKARELYDKAHAAGMQEAKARFDALPP